MKRNIPYYIDASFLANSENLQIFYTSIKKFEKYNIYFISNANKPFCKIYLKTMKELMNIPEIGKHALKGFSWTLYSNPIQVFFLYENWIKIPIHMGSQYTNLHEYRIALVNHELAHVLGFGHVECPRPGLPCDVRQQPSRNLGGCLPTTEVYIYPYANKLDDSDSDDSVDL